MSIVDETDHPDGLRRVVSDLRRWSVGNLRYAANLVLPPICLHCQMPVADYGVLCASCWGNIDFLTPSWCDRLRSWLRHAEGEAKISETALRHPPLYDRARAVARFDGVMRNLIFGFKYADRHEAADMFARMMRSAGAELLQDADIIMPVPLHPRRLWKRRYNQAAILAKRLAAGTSIPFDPCTLRRIQQTPSQVGLPSQKRRENVASAFALAPGSDDCIRGKRILLIDDVITTGSTLDSCARVLKGAGVKGVDCLVLAATDFYAKSYI